MQLVRIPVKIWTLYLQIQVPSIMAWASLPLSCRINEVGISEWHLKCIPYTWSILSRIVPVQRQECTTKPSLKPFHCIGNNQQFGGMYCLCLQWRATWAGMWLQYTQCATDLCTKHGRALSQMNCVSSVFTLQFSLPDFTEASQGMNKTYFMLQKFFRNINVSKKLKLRLKNTIIDKTLTYASETWILTKIDREQISLKGKCIEEYQVQYMTKKKKIGEY